MTTQYSFGKSLLKGVVAFVLFSIPFVLQAVPLQYTQLTVGAVLVMVFNALKFWYNSTFA